MSALLIAVKISKGSLKLVSKILIKTIYVMYLKRQTLAYIAIIILKNYAE